jgi:hypothetical protein
VSDKVNLTLIDAAKSSEFYEATSGADGKYVTIAPIFSIQSTPININYYNLRYYLVVDCFIQFVYLSRSIDTH